VGVGGEGKKTGRKGEERDNGFAITPIDSRWGLLRGK